jgi:quercetin dioxygenase-like cupin family protein
MQTFSSTMRRRLLEAVVLMTVVAGPALAQNGRVTMRPGDVPWPAARAGGAGTSGATGIETVILKGDPTKPGLYVMQLRVQKDITIQPHSHKDDRVATVLKGTWYFGYGDKFNEAGLKALEAGSYYTEPPNVPHFARTMGEVVIQIVGNGPTSTTYVNPADDPTKK